VRSRGWGAAGGKHAGQCIRGGLAWGRGGGQEGWGVWGVGGGGCGSGGQSVGGGLLVGSEGV
jgi:hypothetical protein